MKISGKGRENGPLFYASGCIIMQSMHPGRMLWKFYELVMKMLSDLHIFLHT